MKKYIAPLALVVIGLSIITSPNGQVPRTALAFGEFRQIAGSLFLLMGGTLWWIAMKKIK